VLAVVAVAATAAYTFRDRILPAATTNQVLTEDVRRADLVVSITEDGTVESSHNTDIKCEVLGGSTILWIVTDGLNAKKGDELVRFDASVIEDQVNAQKILYEKARAAMIDAEKLYESAEIAVQEYKEGIYLQTLQQLEANVTVAKENLESSRNSLQHTIKMHRKGYVTDLQRDAQAFAVQRSELDLQVAETAKDVLEKFTRAKTLVGLESTRDSSKAKMASEKAAFELEQARLERLQSQLQNCVINAPADGMVVYANDTEQSRRGNQQAIIEEGALVRERQTILRLPDLSKMQVKCTIHESKVDSLKRGMLARIRIQDRDYQGTVTSVATQAEPSNWFSGNVKEYGAVVSIDSDPVGLRPGMTAAVEVLIANLTNVLSVPVQAVVEKSGKFYGWVSTPQGIEARPVVLGLANNTRIEVKDGLTEGERVLLNPRAVVQEAREETKAEDTVDVKERFGGDQPRNMPDIGGAPEGRGAGGPGGPGGPGGGLSLSNLDTDKDGKISREEAPGQMKENFDRIDANGDGSIDAQEFAGAMRRRRQQQEGGGPPGGPGGGP
ncbi:MAG: HlyD family efflux transporter periplasmic adaptor subunit, partial [Pirellulales bacterium]